MTRTDDPRTYHHEVYLPAQLEKAEFGSIEGKVVVVTGAGSRAQH